LWLLGAQNFAQYPQLIPLTSTLTRFGEISPFGLLFKALVNILVKIRFVSCISIVQKVVDADILAFFLFWQLFWLLSTKFGRIFSQSSGQPAAKVLENRGGKWKKVWGHIHNPLLYSQLTNGPNKLECYITLGWKGLPVKHSSLLS
jgi:hypothetical protein